MTENICFICKENLSEGETENIKDRGINSLRKSSSRKKDNKSVQLQI